eukprot:784185-Rhodomonas_salina.1
MPCSVVALAICYALSATPSAVLRYRVWYCAAHSLCSIRYRRSLGATRSVRGARYTDMGYGTRRWLCSGRAPTGRKAVSCWAWASSKSGRCASLWARNASLYGGIASIYGDMTSIHDIASIYGDMTSIYGGGAIISDEGVSDYGDKCSPLCWPCLHFGLCR